MKIALFGILLLLGSYTGKAADTLVSLFSRPVSARMLATDKLGNSYVINTENTLIRYDDNGDSTGFYQSKFNGQIGGIDATNPQKVLLYFPDFAKVIWLDRQLSILNEVDLHRQHIFSSTAVATSSDGKLWVYDPINARMLKLDENATPLAQGADLRQQLSFVPIANFLLERDRQLYLCDSTQGILIFDQFGTYINTIPFKGIKKIQVFGQQLIYLKGDFLHRYDLQTGFEKSIVLPDAASVLDFSMNTNGLFILTNKALTRYRLP
ncbi:MAG: hypothetical protein JST36_08770 [Bacteroidetes bacterium]|nr:hypothetical protein [Bacteroidota bacterium]